MNKLIRFLDYFFIFANLIMASIFFTYSIFNKELFIIFLGILHFILSWAVARTIINEDFALESNKEEVKEK